MIFRRAHAAFVLAVALAIPAAAEEPAQLTTEAERFSYAVGVEIANNLKRQGIEVSPQLVARGVIDAFSNAPLLLSDEEMSGVMQAMNQKLVARQQDKLRADAALNQEEGRRFLEENKAKPGVTVLSSGLQYRVITAGTGPVPAATDRVSVNYRGTLLGGKEFDSSFKRGQPATFPVNGVIPGWSEALKLMKVGSTWQLFIPPELAYGERGAGGVIPPNATLVFEVELLAIEPANQ